MTWQIWWHGATTAFRPRTVAPPELTWPDSHLAEHDPGRIEALLGDLMRLQTGLRLHRETFPEPVVARLVRHQAGVLTLDALVSPRGAPPLVGRVNVTAALPREMVMFSAQALQGGDGRQLRLSCPQELLHLQSRESYRVRSLNGRGLSVELAVPGLADDQALQLLDLSEGGAGVLSAISPGHAGGTDFAGTLRIGGESLRLDLLRVAHAAPRRDGYWRLGLQFLRMDAGVARALRRALAALETSAGA